MSATSENTATKTESDCQKCRNDVKQFIEMMDKRNILWDTAMLYYSVPLNRENGNYYDDTNITDAYIEYSTYKIRTYPWYLFKEPTAILTGTDKLMLPHCKTFDEIYTAAKHKKYYISGCKGIKTDNYIQRMVNITKWRWGTKNPQTTYWEC